MFVGFGAPKQELWIHDHVKDLNVPVAVGIGFYNFLAICSWPDASNALGDQVVVDCGRSPAGFGGDTSSRTVPSFCVYSRLKPYRGCDLREARHSKLKPLIKDRGSAAGRQSMATIDIRDRKHAVRAGSVLGRHHT